MENDIEENCHDQQLLSVLPGKLNEQRKNGANCDYVLKTEDGGSFAVHRCVLESIIPFFETMFNSEFNDKEKNYSVVKRCSSVVLEKIIEFTYAGQVKITLGIAKETIDTALFLGLNSLVDACTRLLVKTVNCKSCFELLAYSETYFRGEALKKKCIETLAANIQTLRDASEFDGMPLDSIKSLCSCDRNLCNDEQLYLAIVKWIKFDIENREQHISVLLDFIEFGEISLKFAIEEILNDNSLWKNEDYFSKIIKVISKNWRQQLPKNQNQKLFNCSETKNLYAVVGDRILLYDSNKNFSHIITQLADNRRIFGHSTFVEKNFFVCGGNIKGQKSNSSTYFSLEDKCWKSLPPMGTPRSRNRAITLNNQIYVCGGAEEKTVEIFDINESKWMSGPSFERDMESLGLCLYNGNIYAVEGSSIQFLDTRTQKWISLPSLSQNLDMYSAVNYKDYIYGFAEEVVFTFDIRANKWLEDVTMYKECLDVPWSCMIGNEIYVFAKMDENGAFMLNAYKATDFSENICHMMNLEWKKDYCYALFSL